MTIADCYLGHIDKLGQYMRKKSGNIHPFKNSIIAALLATISKQPFCPLKTLQQYYYLIHLTSHQKEKQMEIYTNGTAKISHINSGKVFDIESSELEWEATSGEDRGMGASTT